jgi:hypothetical protein
MNEKSKYPGASPSIREVALGSVFGIIKSNL